MPFGHSITFPATQNYSLPRTRTHCDPSFVKGGEMLLHPNKKKPATYHISTAPPSSARRKKHSRDRTSSQQIPGNTQHPGGRSLHRDGRARRRTDLRRRRCSRNAHRADHLCCTNPRCWTRCWRWGRRWRWRSCYTCPRHWILNHASQDMRDTIGKDQIRLNDGHPID
jgi:hypothetical protein